MSTYVQNYEKKLLKKQFAMIVFLLVLGIMLQAGLSILLKPDELEKPVDLEQVTSLDNYLGEYFSFSIRELSDVIASDASSHQYAFGSFGEKEVIIRIPYRDLDAAEKLIQYWLDDEEVPDADVLKRTGLIILMDQELREIGKEYISYWLEEEITDEDFDKIVWPVVLDTTVSLPVPEEASQPNLLVWILPLVLLLLVYVLSKYKSFRKQVELHVTTPAQAQAFDEEMEATPILNFRNSLRITKNWIIIGGGKFQGFHMKAIHKEDLVCIFGEKFRHRGITYRRIVFKNRFKKSVVVDLSTEEELQNLLENVQSKLPWAHQEDYHKNMGIPFDELAQEVAMKRKAYEENLNPEVFYEGEEDLSEM